jgi:hypothetical protein
MRSMSIQSKYILGNKPGLKSQIHVYKRIEIER